MPFSARQLLIPTSVAVLLLGVAFQRYWNSVKAPHDAAHVAPSVGEREILPANVTPTHYNLKLKPDLDKLTFDGTVDVTLNVNHDTSTITLNAKELEIHSAYVAVGTTKYTATDITYDASLERCTFKFDGTLHAGTTAMLHVAFTGIHNDKMSGFYRSGYKGSNGEQKHMVVTQFEATHARKAFPCWDEPAIKATFDVTLTVKHELTALSNMNDVEETDHSDGWKSVRFGRTPVMSTYLLAFAVGEFEYIEKNTSGEHNGRPVRIRVYTLPGLSNQGHFSLDCACKTLEFFAGVFGIAYPLPKMDMIAVPDFDAGAMENWGLVTYRTVLLLWDPKTSSASTKQSIAYVVAHELAHQWFGNLVTMEWWSELWLNEGFATWVGWLAVDHLFPEWDIWTSFVSDEMQRGMGLDAMRSSHPIQVELASASQISQIFDAISYSKGASVIRMLSSYLGQDTFLAGIRRYLKRHKYRNASTDDLWKALSEESGRDVKHFMQLWTLKIGHPVLHVTDNPDGTFHVQQNRFLSTGDVKPAEDDTVWWCPLNLVNEAGPVPLLSEKDSVLMTREATYKKPPGQFFKLNYKHSGFYRVHYSKEKLKQLGRAISDGRLSTSDRLGVLADTASLAESGVGSTADLLELIGHFENEKEFIVWNEIAARLESLRSVWFEEPAVVRDALQRLEQKLFSKLARRLGWDYPEGEDLLTSKLRTLALSRAGRAGDDIVIAEARRRFSSFVSEDQGALHPNVRGNALAIVVANGGKAEWETVLEVYRATTTADQKIMALAALGATRDAEMIQRALELSLSSDVRPQDTMYLYNSISSTTEGRYPLWAFVQAHWSDYERMYAGSMGLFGHVVKASTSRFSREEVAREVEAFFSTKDTTHVQRPLEQSLEKLRVNAKWLVRARKDVAAWAAESGI